MIFSGIHQFHDIVASIECHFFFNSTVTAIRMCLMQPRKLVIFDPHLHYIVVGMYYCPVMSNFTMLRNPYFGVSRSIEVSPVNIFKSCTDEPCFFFVRENRRIPVHGALLIPKLTGWGKP